ncbi:kinase-like protein [Sphaerulina musiva SO2202]|uniref:Kinase-like protein n=1 Tax=Sphaerulina musiva (strain SO2202) TaxID=692275 RepID=N1QGA2_SPHMS|nr:kinase-like protein [Sphaerulina musiva SO2202]EMF16201.1 kinase-like protein [Sphaerulina musiva SO2202]
MHSTLVGDSSRIYRGGAVLRPNPQDRNLDILKTESEGKSFIYKRVPKHVFNLSQQIGNDCPSSRHLRMHSILIYPYFRDTFLALLEKDPAFPPDERGKIMRGVGEAVQELHSKDWIYADIKPDNVLVDWTCDSEGNKVVTNRSPESHTGMSNRASDIYSLGLVFLYALGGRGLLILKDYQDLVKAGISAEQAVVVKHFCYFGPVPESLYEQIKDKDWRSAFRAASREAKAADLGEEAIEMLSGMTNLDPRARLTIDQVLALPFWQQLTS